MFVIFRMNFSIWVILLLFSLVLRQFLQWVSRNSCAIILGFQINLAIAIKFNANQTFNTQAESFFRNEFGAKRDSFK